MLTITDDYSGRPQRVRDGWAVTEEEAEFLRGLAIALRPHCIAEIGAGLGRSLQAWCEAAVYLAEHLHWPCDVWACDRVRQMCRIAHLRCPTARVIEGDSHILAAIIAPAPGLIFIDGCHTQDAVMADLRAMQSVATDDAVYVFHDTRPDFPPLRDLAKDLGAITLDTAQGISILTGYCP